MDIVREEFDSAKCYLGKLCKESHEWKDTKQSLRYRSSRGCVTCDGTSSVPISNAQRFWDRVDTSGDCWLWLGSICKGGYGRFPLKDKTQRAHRVAWEMTYGSIPNGLFACHKCDRRACVRPSHLFLGTAADNIKDMIEKGRHACGEKTGTSRLTNEQVLEIRRLHNEGVTASKISLLFHLDFSQVRRIIKREVWKHIP